MVKAYTVVWGDSRIHTWWQLTTSPSAPVHITCTDQTIRMRYASIWYGLTLTLLDFPKTTSQFTRSFLIPKSWNASWKRLPQSQPTQTLQYPPLLSHSRMRVLVAECYGNQQQPIQPTTCATHSSPSIHGGSRNLHTAATLPTAVSFSPYLYSGIQGAPVLHSPLQLHSPHYQMPSSFPITSIATNALSSPGLAEVEIHAIFQCDPKDCKPQIWYVDKMVGHGTAKCASCTRIQMLPGVLHV